MNLCQIPRKVLQRKPKRCRGCGVLSGVEWNVRFRCGTEVRRLRVDVSDRLLKAMERLDRATGGGPLEQPRVPAGAAAPLPEESPRLARLKAGEYDSFFSPADPREKLSALYADARRGIRGGGPRVEVAETTAAVHWELPVYPPLAKQARIAGAVELTFVVGEGGQPRELAVVQGHPLLQESAVAAVKQWRFASEAAGRHQTVRFRYTMNCRIQ